MLPLLVALAAGAGAVSRYVADRMVQARLGTVFPAGTFVVNVTGSLLLGLVVGAGLHHGWNGDVVVVLGSGFLGGYTTLSTWAWESVALTEQGELPAALTNVFASFAAGLAAAAAGLALMTI